MAHTNARAYLPPSARAARVPSRHGLRNAYSTQLSYRRVSLSSAIGGRATLSSRTRAEPRSVASARELGQLPQPYYYRSRTTCTARTAGRRCRVRSRRAAERIFRSTRSKRAVDREHGRSVIVCERTHERCMLTKGELHVVRGTIAEAKPNDLRRRAAQDRQLLEVGVLRHNHSTGRACESPNDARRATRRARRCVYGRRRRGRRARPRDAEPDSDRGAA